METKRPCIRVCACRHVSAPDPPGEGCRFLPTVRGPVTIQGGPGPLWGSGTPRGFGLPREVRIPRLFGLSACFSRNTWCSRTFPNQGMGPGPLLGEQGFRSAEVRPLDVVKDDYKALLA